ncbi:hypothetical protein RFI_06418 [Reticulomyxa filosa]|uniref:Uncharacterized protein n=1 Tax=Reticulomyxa filosa TaxID=46433 RepID=X6NZI6_RETFI|nr:hypothetical protein RFI_06418 [Reticulomyxa filosa]|eukprot:ETO30707.1 hypothetical protein RFI_06418 [Reticulomyxa filosa]
MCSVVLFWTSYCAIDIFNGKPKADTDSTSFHNFESGLTFGVFGLLLMALVQINASLLYETINSLVSTRNLFLFGEYGMSITYKITLLIFISLFGFFIELHLQTSQRLSQHEFLPLVIEFNKTSQKRVMLNYLLEFESAFGPLFVSAFGGPFIFLCHKHFGYAFLLPALLMFILDSIVFCIFNEFLPWKLPPPREAHLNSS